MSYIVRKILRGGKLSTLARMCELRNIETSVGDRGKRNFAVRSRDELLALLSSDTEQPIHLRQQELHDYLRLVCSKDQFQTAYDSDSRVISREQLSLEQMLFHPTDANAPGDAYTQAEVCEHLDSMGVPYRIESDYIVDGVLCVGDVVADMESQSTSQFVSNSLI